MMNSNDTKMNTIIPEINGFLIMIKKINADNWINKKKIKNLFRDFCSLKKPINSAASSIKLTITAAHANPSIKRFKFITKEGRLGSISGSLKYRIVES